AYSSASAAGGDSRRCIATLALQRIGQQFAQRATTLVERGALGRIGGIAQQAVAHRFVTRIDLIRWINPRGTMASLVGGQVLVARSDAYHFTRRCRWCSHGRRGRNGRLCMARNYRGGRRSSGRRCGGRGLRFGSTLWMAGASGKQERAGQ